MPTESSEYNASGLTAEAIAALKDKHGHIHELESATGECIIVRRPKLPEWERFRAEMRDPQKALVTGKNLLNLCLVHPERAQWEVMRSERPGLQETMQMLFVEHVAGMTFEGKHRAL